MNGVTNILSTCVIQVPVDICSNGGVIQETLVGRSGSKNAFVSFEENWSNLMNHFEYF